MAHLKTQIDLISKHMMGVTTQNVSVVATKEKSHKTEYYSDSEEEAKFVNQSGGYQGKGNQGRNHYRERDDYRKDEYHKDDYQKDDYRRDDFRKDHELYVPPKVRDRASGESSRMEEMLEKVLKRVESFDQGIKEMRGDISK